MSSLFMSPDPSISTHERPQGLSASGTAVWAVSAPFAGVDTDFAKEGDKVTGAGDEIRTHDPNLGKVVLYP